MRRRLALLAAPALACAIAAPSAHAQDQPVNTQITDAVTQTNVKLLGEAPAMAMGDLYQAAAQSTGLMARNATMSDTTLDLADQAATTQAVQQLYSVDTAASPAAVALLLGHAPVTDTIGLAGCGSYLTAALLIACLQRAS